MIDTLGHEWRQLSIERQVTLEQRQIIMQMKQTGVVRVTAYGADIVHLQALDTVKGYNIVTENISININSNCD